MLLYTYFRFLGRFWWNSMALVRYFGINILLLSYAHLLLDGDDSLPHCLFLGLFSGVPSNFSLSFLPFVSSLVLRLFSSTGSRLFPIFQFNSFSHFPDQLTSLGYFHGRAEISCKSRLTSLPTLLLIFLFLFLMCREVIPGN